MKKMPKMSRVLRSNCRETCHNIPQKKPYEWVYQEDFINKTDNFSESLQQFLINCQFSYVGNWELVKSMMGIKFRRGHVCLHSQAGNIVPITGSMIISS